MKACLAEYENCDVCDIADKYIEGRPQISAVPVLPDKYRHEGTVSYDVRFGAVVPGSGERIRLIVNVEAQNDFCPGYPLLKRGIYYCCWMTPS